MSAGPRNGPASCSARLPVEECARDVRATRLPIGRGRGWRVRLSDLPQRPIVGYDARSGELLSEYCVRFRDGSDPEAGERLPDADDVLAKWLALRDGRGAHDRERPTSTRWDASSIRRWCAATWLPCRTGRRGVSTPQGGRGDERRSAAAVERRLRRPRASLRARLHEGDRLRRRRPAPPDRRDRQHLDRGDAVQLPPPRACRARQGGRPSRGRHPARVQLDRDLRRNHDGDRGDEDLAGQPRGDRGLDRADGARLPVRRRDRALRLRQDDSRLRDGARPPRRPLADALRRLDPARSLAGQGRDDPGRLRGDRQARHRRDDRTTTSTSSRAAPARAPAPAARSSPPTRWPAHSR